MAVSFARSHQSVVGDLQLVVGDVTFDSSYPAGGEAVTAALFGLNGIKSIQCSPAVDPDTVDNAFVCAHDRANSKLLLFTHGTDAAADAPLKELAATTSAAAYTAQVAVYGW